MARYLVTYVLDGEEYTENMSEGKLANMEKRIERGNASEQIVNVQSVATRKATKQMMEVYV